MNLLRSHLALLVSSLSLIFTLGAGTVVPPATHNNARHRQTRRHRVGNPRTPHLIRELDRHATGRSRYFEQAIEPSETAALIHGLEKSGSSPPPGIVSRTVRPGPDRSESRLLPEVTTAPPVFRPISPIGARAPPASHV